ncbi:hypothetical protein BAOM_2991 [Peribacillus asahii]|uniref:Uncharacterized protein n=1 Tax=Peribacillus asahii TaxID=228899 RepID=A0A3Q9RPU3_9BACI|nr:hypothetical protein BAOM_2991 [Peribacillus asahii]
MNLVSRSWSSMEFFKGCLIALPVGILFWALIIWGIMKLFN